MIIAYIRSRTGEMTPEDVEEEMPRRPGRINLLSVGRFCYAKNYDNVPDICRCPSFIFMLPADTMNS